MTAPERVPQPRDGDERDIALGWLAFHRNAFEAKCAGLDAERLATRSSPPSPLSLLGLMRHLAEMERAYGSWALGPARPLVQVWGVYTDDGPEHDIEADPSMLAESMRVWADEQAATDAALDHYDDLGAVASGNGRSVRWNLAKLTGEYARHNGHADLVRERIDGSTGE